MNWEELLCPKRIREITKSTVSNDLRTEFEKDYHRIIGSSSFRRLQDKTQVFPLDNNDFIRTRLTHSLEVSSFCKSLGQNVGNKLVNDENIPDFGPQQKEDICAILQCAGLIHDIGNPPFGHFGEDVIREWFEKNLRDKELDKCLSPQQFSDFCNFEGNTQALRVVSKLHYLVDEHGMNLTKALLATIIKYPVNSLQIDKSKKDIKSKKMGYFAADEDIFNDIEKSTGTNGARHPLCFLLEAADDIAYKTADIEDSLKKGLISYDELVSELEKYDAENNCNKTYKDAVEILKHKYESGKKRNVYNKDEYAVKNWIIAIQGQMLYAASDSFIDNYNEIMEGTYKYELFKGSKVEELMDVLGKIAYKYAFCTKNIFKLEIAAETILSSLLEKFVNAAINMENPEKQGTLDKRVIALISEDYRKVYEEYSYGKSEEEKLYLRLLLVTDYISGMTDSYAKNLYQELNGIA